LEKIFSFWNEFLVCKRFFDVNYIADSVFVAGSLELLPSPVDLVGCDDLAVWPNLVLGAKLEDLIGSGDTTNQRASDGLSCEHERCLIHLMWSEDESHLNQDSSLVEQTKV
jgi:hypothetical protein